MPQWGFLVNKLDDTGNTIAHSPEGSVVPHGQPITSTWLRVYTQSTYTDCHELMYLLSQVTEIREKSYIIALLSLRANFTLGCSITLQNPVVNQLNSIQPLNHSFAIRLLPCLQVHLCLPSNRQCQFINWMPQWNQQPVCTFVKFKISTGISLRPGTPI